jgi:hypothetical protein
VEYALRTVKLIFQTIRVSGGPAFGVARTNASLRIDFSASTSRLSQNCCITGVRNLDPGGRSSCRIGAAPLAGAAPARNGLMKCNGRTTGVGTLDSARDGLKEAVTNT